MSRSQVPVRVRWMVLGLLVVQVGWVFAVPPFRGIDEWDHAYRASAVAHGEWVAAPSAATRGTGALVAADADLVAAARLECERLPYTGVEECVGRDVGGGLVEVASGAGRYHPLYYAAVGIPGLMFEGTWALYGMRAVSMLLCLALMGWSLWSLTRWTGARPLLAVWCGMTPMLVYSTAVVAPNGLEMAAGLGLWAALAGLAHDQDREKGYLVLAAVAGVLLVTLRSLGPLWAFLIVLGCLIAWPSLRSRVSAGRGKASWATAFGAMFVATTASLLWIVSQRSLALGQEADQPTAMGDRIVSILPHGAFWAFQMIGTFPYRNEVASPLVYAGIGSVLLLLLAAGLRWSRGPTRGVLVLGLLVLFLVPFVISVATIDDFGHAWQGRYALPYAIGLALLCGLVWQTRTARNEIVGPLIPGVLMLVLGHVAGPVQVLRRELEDSPLAGTTSWQLAPEPWVLGVLVAVGALLAVAPTARAVYSEATD